MVENVLTFPCWFIVSVFHVDAAVYSFLVIFHADVGEKLAFPFCSQKDNLSNSVQLHEARQQAGG